MRAAAAIWVLVTEGAHMDHVSPETRSLIMSRVRSQDTSPELAVRKLLHSAGFRFRLHRKDLPGKPDIILPKHRLALFVHGCFWHGHSGCSKGRLPKSRLSYWAPKIRANQNRDARNMRDLESLGWTVAVIWGCETRRPLELAQQLCTIIDKTAQNSAH